MSWHATNRLSSHILSHLNSAHHLLSISIQLHNILEYCTVIFIFTKAPQVICHADSPNHIDEKFTIFGEYRWWCSPYAGSVHICSDSKVNMLAFLNKQTTNPSLWKQHMDLLDKKGKNYLLRCKYCRLEFRGSSSRAKAHLVGKGKGVRFCTSIPPMVRANLLEEINPTKTIDETEACSSKKKKTKKKQI